MEYYKKYRVLENTELAQIVNLFIKFFNSIPLLGRLSNGKYRLYGLKNFLYKLRPIFRLIYQFIVSLLAMFLSLLLTGIIFNLIDKFFGTNYNAASDVIDSAAAGSYAFLAFYLAQALLANKIVNARPFIKTLYRQWRIHPKAIALSLSFFTSLREAIGRGLSFSFMFILRPYPIGAIGAFLISFIIMFISMSMTAVHLYLYATRGRDIKNKFIYYLIFFAIAFALLLKLEAWNLYILIGIFLILLIIYIRASLYIFSFDNYEEILTGTKDFDQMQVEYKKDYEKKNELKEDVYISSDRDNGYEFLNNIFFARYKGMFSKPLFKKNLIILAINSLVLFYINNLGLDRDMIKKYIPTLIIFISYYLYNHESFTQMIFEKCDRCLMSYSFYKRPEALENMYRIRFKKLLINNIFGVLLGVFLGTCYSIFFGFSNLKTLVTILYMLVGGFYFISFALSMYYIYQPYNYEGMIISSNYKILSSIHAYLLFFILPMIFNYSNINSNFVMASMIILMVVFMVIAPYLVRRFGGENFRIQK